MAIDNLIKTMIDELKKSIQCQTVVGDPITAGDVTVIPVSKVSFGFAAGGGEKKKTPNFGAGTGGGATIEPVAFIVISKDGVKLLPLKKTDKWIDKLLDPENYEKLNEVFEKITGKNKKEGKSKKIEERDENEE
jgi:sporulation protein YtfJ